jgi:alpha-L-rhamnosidase
LELCKVLEPGDFTNAKWRLIDPENIEMKNHEFARIGALTGLLMAATVSMGDPAGKTGASPLDAGFVNPPDECRPRTWWHWVNENVTEDGITKDLEAMKRVGLKGAQITNIYQGGPPEAQGEDVILSPAWIRAVTHAAKECERLGLTLGASSAAGCSGSGGPWITPELSMQEVVWRRKFVNGPVSGRIQLPQPPANHGYYRDIAVLAFPTLPGDAVPVSALHPKIQSDLAGLDWAAALDGDDETFVTLPAPKAGEASHHVIFEFENPVPVRSLSLQMHEDSKNRELKLLTSEDGTKWVPAGAMRRWRSEFTPAREELIEGFQGRDARFVMVEFTAASPAVPMKLYDLNFQSTRLDQIHTKAARMRTQPQVSTPSQQKIHESQLISLDQIVDLTDRMLPSGELQCDLPAGEWTILRIGHTSNGNEVKPASERAKGLEVDKMSAEALEYHFNNGMLGKMCDLLGPLTGKVFIDVNVDSWEAGCQTWTRKFPQEFAARRGYDSRKWLVTLTGRIVGNLDLTERFLWDYRRTVGDLLAANFYGKFQELFNKRGIKLEAEAPGIGMPALMDQIQCLGKTDIPQGEFWIEGEPDPVNNWRGGQDNTKEAAVAAHVYGRKIVSCESFTSFGHHDGWTQYPYRIKALGDRQFCKGMNEIVFHRYVHQPDDRFPGMSLGQFGLNFDRTLTWWEQGRAWVDYLTRCQHMLRQGSFVADVCYYYGEDVPNSAWYSVPGVMDPRQKMLPVLPNGYDYDVCDRTTFDTMRVEDGFVVLPSGMRYAYLVLPDSARFTPAALQKVGELVMAGATVIGPRPSRSPSMNGYPNADREIARLAQELWPPAAGPAQRKVGKGRVITGKSFKTIFKEDAFLPDFSGNSKDEDIHYIHRIIPEGDLYFVSFQKDQAEERILSFRVTGKTPEIWDPATGVMSEILMYRDDGKSTSVSMRMANHDAKFIVFRKPSMGTLAVTDLRQNEKPVRSLAGGVAELSEFAPELSGSDQTNAMLVAWESGNYDVAFQGGRQASLTIEGLPAPETVPEKWWVNFQKDRGAPTVPVGFDRLKSWTNRPEDAIRYFSGTASYVQGVNVSRARLESGRRVWLDLGDVRHLAEVIVNDKTLGVLWKPPYRVDITGAAKPGANKIEVRVTNVWKNRLVGDAKLPPESRLTWTFYPFYKADDSLVESGLLGPVRLLSSESVRLNPGPETDSPNP